MKERALSKKALFFAVRIVLRRGGSGSGGSLEGSLSLSDAAAARLRAGSLLSAGSRSRCSLWLWSVPYITSHLSPVSSLSMSRWAQRLMVVVIAAAALSAIQLCNTCVARVEARIPILLRSWLERLSLLSGNKGTLRATRSERRSSWP